MFFLYLYEQKDQLNKLVEVVLVLVVVVVVVAAVNTNILSSLMK
jgi:heme/copper-type cytochrome/quinol oxidase subunit 4